MDNSLLTVREVSDILRLHENTVLKLLAERKLPGIKVGNSWRCSRADINQFVNGVAIDGPDIHEWFNLTYASYLVVPRVVLQSMPEKWQKRFVALLNEMNESIDWPDKKYGDNYSVFLRAKDGKFVKDDLANYERGRRTLPLKNRSL